MAKVTIGFGIAFILVGLAPYVLSDPQSWTAAIPALFGVVFVILGSLALAPSRLMYMIAMHVAPIVALLAMLGTAKGLFEFLGMVSTDRPEASPSKAATFVLALILFCLYIWSFVSARLKPKTELGERGEVTAATPDRRPDDTTGPRI